jgi:cbb3-type cytochrome oxidase subunit 3
MSTYEILQSVVAYWGLAAVAVIFTIVVVYALLPSNRGAFDEASRIPLRED